MQETAPGRNCDIIMKGGITSGVVYPLAIVELADEFRFKSIGGTSAGAIAAAVTAAAEYQRVTKQTADGFRRLEKLPEFLAGETGGESNLLNLFPPTKPTRALFAFAMALTGGRHFAIRVALAAFRLLFVSSLLTVAAFLPALIVLVALVHQWGSLSPADAGGLAVVFLLLVATGLVLLAVAAAVRALCFTIPGNRFGFSTGCKPDDRKLPGVTEWLHDEVQRAAGRTSADAPLTFGDLWTAGTNATLEQVSEQVRADAGRRAIDLQMITTALTHGRPYRLPFEKGGFAFRVSELTDYFPAPVLSHLCSKGTKVETPQFDDLYELPAPEELPIVVATRLSLSFPILFTLVPLYAVDYTTPAPATGTRPHERTWFIDGGLSSNFPLNLFDAPFPRWPTFGINLTSPHAAHPIDTDEDKNVWMVPDNRSGHENRWFRIPATGVPALAGYLAAVLDTIRNWRDNTQMSAPGFRDRVVHIMLSPKEGGLNLDMDPEKVKRLTRRGSIAGQRLRARFGKDGATNGPPNWNSHRWTRYKIAMTVLQKAMRNLDAAFAHADPPYPAYDALTARVADENPKTWYWWKSGRADFQSLTAKFVAFAGSIRQAPVEFDDESPEGKPELRITARM